MKGFFGKIQAGFQRFMQGRYGSDKLNKTLVWVAFGAYIISLFIPVAVVKLGLILVSYVLIAWSFIRMLSRNVYKRYQENRKFLQFVEKFKEEIPRYMIKHQVRPGLTGWAQINGYRGDTSIRKRIDYDLYYIENWTMGFDFKIMFLTIFKGFVNENAY